MEEKRGGETETLVGIAATQGRDDDVWKRDGGGGGGEKWMESRHFFQSVTNRIS